MVTIFKYYFVIMLLIGNLLHLLTTIIAFVYGGTIDGILTIFFPFIAELYWIIKMIPVLITYSWIMIIYFIIFLPIIFVNRNQL